MNFREIEELENLVSSKETHVVGISSFQKQMLSEYFEKEKRKSTAKESSFEYFYEDVIAVSLAFSFQKALGEQCYQNASDDAFTCLEICNEFRKLSTWNVSGWLQNALKFTPAQRCNYIISLCTAIPCLGTGGERCCAKGKQAHCIE